jgi:hypothetical protein
VAGDRGSNITQPIMLDAEGRSPRVMYAAGTLTRTEMAPSGEMREGLAREYAIRLPSSPNIIKIVPIHQRGTLR